ncbi:hypothetical protein GQ44DRAFT_770893 [Phaeosphaeriaceae sp. PMI808]|nr:hypothetical protein GQ44DRAFT_770893 [Phaeosphaeriaceae sp. PMI808]
MATLKLQASNVFESFRLKSSDDQFSSFAVESRIQTQARSEALADIRIAIKDSIGPKGIKNSIGNKAFYDNRARPW